MAFTQCVADPCLFYKVVFTKDFAIMSVYVDDILLCTTTEQIKDSIIKELYDKFKITDEGDFTWSLGMHVETSPDRHTIKLDMQRYIINALTRFNFDDLKTSTIPMDPNVKFSENDCPTDQNAKNEMKLYPFREALGVLMFLMVTMRFDIAFPTISLSRFSNNTSKKIGAKRSKKSAPNLSGAQRSTTEQNGAFTRKNAADFFFAEHNGVKITFGGAKRSIFAQNANSRFDSGAERSIFGAMRSRFLRSCTEQNGADLKCGV